jgi:hypothetical protein
LAGFFEQLFDDFLIGKVLFDDVGVKFRFKAKQRASSKAEDEMDFIVYIFKKSRGSLLNRVGSFMKLYPDRT